MFCSSAPSRSRLGLQRRRLCRDGAEGPSRAGSIRYLCVMEMIRISRALAGDVASLGFAAPVTHVYNPLEYARKPHERYLKRYSRAGCEALMLGMNPGPWGMVQTGVPFGEVAVVRDWLGIDDAVAKPAHEHPKRPVEGFGCPRSEVSGRRLWGWARDTFKTPDRFFERFFIANYCPLAFMEDTSRNRTPDKLPARERNVLFAACDLALRRTVERLRPRMVIGVGRFAESRARAALDGCDIPIHTILHPSPASPLANKGWAGTASAQLRALGLRV